ncbi:MAG: nuclear transport factor 2 family protein, partial [Stellaceae bacterium]
TCDVIGFSPPVGDIQAGHHSGASMTEAEMDNLTELIDRYIAMWNETDAGRRRVLIAQTWTEDARYIDPMLQAEGQASIDAMICGVHERFPGHRFRRTSEPDAHHDRVRFAWELAPEGAPAVVKGTDFAVVADQRLRSVTGFFDQVASEARGD